MQILILLVYKNQPELFMEQQFKLSRFVTILFQLNIGYRLTAVTDIYDNIYNEDIGEWVFTPQTITGTLTDFTIDLSFGAAGVAADYVINNVGIFDCDGDGKKDSAVDVAKKSVDSVLKDMFNWQLQ